MSILVLLEISIFSYLITCTLYYIHIFTTNFVWKWHLAMKNQEYRSPSFQRFSYWWQDVCSSQLFSSSLTVESAGQGTGREDFLKWAVGPAHILIQCVLDGDCLTFNHPHMVLWSGLLKVSRCCWYSWPGNQILRTLVYKMLHINFFLLFFPQMYPSGAI